MDCVCLDHTNRDNTYQSIQLWYMIYIVICAMMILWGLSHTVCPSCTNNCDTHYFHWQHHYNMYRDNIMLTFPEISTMLFIFKCWFERWDNIIWIFESCFHQFGYIIKFSAINQTMYDPWLHIIITFPCNLGHSQSITQIPCRFHREIPSNLHANQLKSRSR